MNQTQLLTRQRTPTQAICQALLRLQRWQIIGLFPVPPKCIVVGAPHTTNWDFYYMLLLKGATGVDLRWIGKEALFRWPFGGFMKWLGGIPVNRRIRNQLVDQMVELFQNYDRLALAITPEGTRSKAHYWKTGFYHIAMGVQAPVVLVAIDYSSRSLEFGPLLVPSGDIEKDFEIIRKFYTGKQGKYPVQQGEIRLRPENE
jgi:1-acyl-sn-glycerol-3-phosphate acyltransferase